MNETAPHFDLPWVVGVLRRRWWAIALLVVVVFVAVFGLSSLREEVYSSTADVRFTGGGARVFDSDEDDDEVFLGNEIYLVTSAAVRQAVEAEIGGEAMGRVRKVGGVQVADTDVMRITVSSTSPEVARDAADAYADTYTSIRQQDVQELYARQAEQLRATASRIAEEIVAIEEQIAGEPSSAATDVRILQRQSLIAQQSELSQRAFELELESAERASTIRVAKTANLPTLPDSPTPLRDAGVAALVALVVAVGAVFLVEQLDTRVKAGQDLSAVTGGVPVLGTLPVLGGGGRFRRGDARRALVPPSSPSAEAYRALATSLRFSGLGKQKKRILITSALSGEGKTSLTANLAAVLAENGLRVLVVSADLRRPQLAETLGATDTERGLTTVILGDEELVDVLVSAGRSDDEAITLLPSGPLPHDPSVLLGSDEFGEMLEQFEKAGADFILIDCAPVLPVSDALAVARHVDGVIMVTQHGRAKQGELSHAVDRLETVDAEVIGIVVNRVPGTESVYMGGYGYAATT